MRDTRHFREGYRCKLFWWDWDAVPFCWREVGSFETEEECAASVKIFVHGRTLTVMTMEFLLNISWHAYVTERHTESTTISCTKLDYTIV